MADKHQFWFCVILVDSIIVRALRTSTSTMSRRGAFIVVEGLDRSGKSTQADLLSKKLQALGQAKLLKFPGPFPLLSVSLPQLNVHSVHPDRTTPIGKMIDAYLRSQSELDDRAIHLLFSANRWELVFVSGCGCLIAQVTDNYLGLRLNETWLRASQSSATAMPSLAWRLAQSRLLFPSNGVHSQT